MTTDGDPPTTVVDVFPITNIPKTPLRDKLSEKRPIPIVEEATHYLHIIVTEGQNGRDEYRYMVSPFDKHLTLRWLRNRAIVTRFGLDDKPCDYLETRYLCSHFYHLASGEIAVWHLIYSSAMAEASMFSPSVQDLLDEDELASLLDAQVAEAYIKLSADNATLREQVRWWEENTQMIIDAKDETGGKMFAHFMDMASTLPETDRIRVIGGENPLQRIIRWVNERPLVKQVLTIMFLVLLIVGLLAAVGVIRIGGR